MKRWLKFIILVSITILISFFICFYILVYSKTTKNNIIDEQQVAEYNETKQLNDLEVINTNYSGLKVSPNSIIVFEKKYNKCNHKEVKEEKVKESIVNLNELELQELYPDWTIKQFSTDKIILYQEIDGYCDEHYVLKEKDRYIGVFKILQNGEEELAGITNISVQYLPETDNLNIKKGLKVYKKESLNKILEDFE